MRTNTAECQSLELITPNTLDIASECLRTIAHPCRLQIISILLQEECSVGELANFCSIPSSTASEHLRLLKDRGILSSRREGRKIFYQVNDPALEKIIQCVRTKFN